MGHTFLYGLTATLLEKPAIIYLNNDAIRTYTSNEIKLPRALSTTPDNIASRYSAQLYNRIEATYRELADGSRD